MARYYAILRTETLNGATVEVIENTIVAESWSQGVDITDHRPIPAKGWVRQADGSFLPPAEEPRPATLPRRISRMAFHDRFLLDELVHLKLVAAINPTDPAEAQRLSAEVAIFDDKLKYASYVDLDDERTVNYLNYLVYLGVLDEGRARQILTAPVQDHERP